MMPAVKAVGYLLGAALGLLGVIFVAGHQGEVLRIVVGGVLIAGGIGLVVALRLRPTVVQQQITQRVELSGDVRTQSLTCDRCGASLPESSVTVRAGAVFVACQYCQASYQLEEAPKW